MYSYLVTAVGVAAAFQPIIENVLVEAGNDMNNTNRFWVSLCVAFLWGPIILVAVLVSIFMALENAIQFFRKQK
jgi:hypothetical protein